jgi:glycosyltransferase involved in cell wall biosynthesis
MDAMTGDRTRPLSIGYVLKMFPRFSETFILNEILELERRGTHITVFSMKVPDESLRQPDLVKLRAPVLTIPAFRGSGLWGHLIAHTDCLLRSPVRYLRTLEFVRRRRSRSAWRKFLMAPYIVRCARQRGIEHLHAHFASGPTRQAKLVSLLSGLTFSFTAHAKDLFWQGHQHGTNNKLKKRLRLAAFVVVISDFNHRFLRSLNFRVPRRRVLTVYNGLNLARWPFQSPAEKRWDEAEPLLVLAVGRLVPKKGFDVLLRACEILKNSGYEFRCVIIGEGPERPRLESLRDELGLASVVEIPGAIPQDRVRDEFMRHARVLVQPSVIAPDGDQDGIPTVLLEAMACGVPVVATPTSGIPEAVDDGETGLLVAPGDGAATAVGIGRLLDDGELAARLAEGARRRIERSFNIKRSVKVLRHLFGHAARGDVRWSENKIRQSIGLGPRTETTAEEVCSEAEA